MKQALTALLIAVFSLSAIAQDPDPQLFQTWYLYDMSLDGSAPPRFVEPPIAPTITINPDLSFTGFGACNEFNGQFVYHELAPNEGYLEVIEFEFGTEDCQNVPHNAFEHNFEGEFTTHFWNFYFEGSPEEQWLRMWHLFNGYCHWANYPVLSVPVVEQLQARAYPNPARGQLTVEFPQPVADLKLQLLDLSGRLVQEAHYQELQLVQMQTGVPPGLYLLSIQTGAGRQVVKLLVE